MELPRGEQQRGVMSSGVERAQRNDTSPAMRGSAIILEYLIEPIQREFPVRRHDENKKIPETAAGRFFPRVCP